MIVESFKYIKLSTFDFISTMYTVFFLILALMAGDILLVIWLLAKKSLDGKMLKKLIAKDRPLKTFKHL